MNPFANATIMGYGPNDILKFLQTASPKMAEKVQKAMALGYSAEEIMEFLGKSFDGSTPKNKQRGPDYESAMRIMGENKPESMKQARAERENKQSDVLSTVLTRGGPALAGAGIGALAGGPMGAATGAAAGFAGSDDLMKKYEEHVQTGGSLSLMDWLKSIMKGGAAGAAASQAPKLLAALQAAGMGGEGQPEGAAPEGAAEQPVDEITEATEVSTRGNGPQESFELLKAKGAGGVFEGIAKQVDSPHQMKLALEKLYGKKWLDNVGSEAGRPSMEIVEEAFEFVRAKGANSDGSTGIPTGSEGIEEVSTGTTPVSTGIPTESEVEGAALVELGQAPGAVVDPVQQAPIVPQEATQDRTDIPLSDIKVRLSDVKIADENLKKGKGSVTPDAPVELEYNVSEEKLELTDGYHRWLSKRGGSLDEAMKTKPEGNIKGEVKFVKNVESGGFTKQEELSEAEIKDLEEKARLDGDDKLLNLIKNREKPKEDTDKQQSGRNVKQLDMGDGDESSMADVFSNIFTPLNEPYEKAPSDKKRKIAPLANALKSSNVRGGQWNEETGEMRITFQPKKGSSEGGSVYTYPGVDKKTWEGLTGGDAQPITEGSNIFGFWDRGKKRSIGAFFSKEIKKKADQFPPTQLAEEDINVDEHQVRQADRAFMVSDLFEPFKKQRAEGRRLTKAEDLKEWVSDYADHDSDDIYTMIEIVQEKLASVLKDEPSTARLKKEITAEFGVKFNPTEAEKEKLAKKEAKDKERAAKKAAKTKEQEAKKAARLAAKKRGK